MSAINHLGLLWESKQTNHQNKYWHCTCTFYISLCSLLKFYVVTTLFLRKQRAHTIGSLYFRRVIKVKCFDFYLELPNSYFMFAWMVPYKVCSSHFIENTGCIRALNSCLFHNAVRLTPGVSCPLFYLLFSDFQEWDTAGCLMSLWPHFQ